MEGRQPGTRNGIAAAIERRLMNCVEWSQMGRHRRVLTEVERMLANVAGEPAMEAALLIWKAQALLAMGCPERALPAAARSWELDESPHACHLMASSLYSMGEADEAEEMLRLGWRLFADAAHLPVQLAMMLTDQGRLPEALDTLADLPATAELPDDLQVFLFGLRANLLATMGRWYEADELLIDGLRDHPDSSFLHEAHESLSSAWGRWQNRERLVDSWQQGLEELDGVAREVDHAILRSGAILESSRLEVLAARRLWRAVATTGIRPQAPEPWGAAALLAVAELDGNRPSAAAIARAVAASPATVRSALRRFRDYLCGLEHEFALRSFAADQNPRLDAELDDPPSDNGRGRVLAFPSKVC